MPIRAKGRSACKITLDGKRVKGVDLFAKRRSDSPQRKNQTFGHLYARCLRPPYRGLAAGDLQHLQLHNAAGGVGLYGLADAGAHQSLANGALAGNPQLHRVSLGIADDGILVFLIVLHVVHLYAAADVDHVQRGLGVVHEGR